MNTQNNFFCENCNFICKNKYDYTRHLKTMKHKKLLTESSQYVCFCNKQYTTKSGFWKHIKICDKYIDENANLTNVTETQLSINNLLKELEDYKKTVFDQNQQISELSKQIIELSKLNSNTINFQQNNNNNNNKTFNLQFFLNETCKDAMNIDDFAKSIKIDLEDVEKVGEKGYIEGISSIIIKNLNNIEEHLRPLHCSDYKREVIYIRDNNKWIKETDDKPILTKAIKTIAHENVKQIKQWTQKYKDYNNFHSKRNDVYLQIVSNSMNGSTSEESTNNIKKVVNNISKEVVIKKY